MKYKDYYWLYINGTTCTATGPKKWEKELKSGNIDRKAKFKTESIRKLSNCNCKILYQNNLKHIAFFFTFFERYGCSLSVITPKTISHGSLRK